MWVGLLLWRGLTGSGRDFGAWQYVCMLANLWIYVGIMKADLILRIITKKKMESTHERSNLWSWIKSASEYPTD